MQRRTHLLGLIALITAALLPLAAHAQTALDDVMATQADQHRDPDRLSALWFCRHRPQAPGPGRRHGQLHRCNKLGVKVELVAVTSANRIPYLQTKKADLVISTLGKNPERAAVIDFTAAYSPFFQAVFAAEEHWRSRAAADLAGKSVGVTRGAIEDMELTKIAPASADVKRFEDNNATVSAFVSGQVQVIATGASVAGNMMGRNPQLGTEYKFVLKDSPNFIGVGKGEDKLRLKVNRDHRRRQGLAVTWTRWPRNGLAVLPARPARVT